MATPMSIRLLYLGRNKKLPQQIGEALQQEIKRNNREPRSMPVLQLVRATSQKRAVEEIRQAPPHGVLVEVDDGRYNRNRFCHSLRNRLPKVVIVAIHKDSSYPNDFDFDGYIQRPFAVEQAQPMLARLLDGGQGMYIQYGHLYLDVAMRTVDGPQGKQHLPPKLCKLLQLLMEQAGTTVRREELMQSVWETRFLGDTRTLDVHIRWLREKIEPDPSNPIHLVTVRGQGYRLEKIVDCES